VIDSIALSPDGSMLAFQNTTTPALEHRAGSVVADMATGGTVRLLDAISSRPSISFSPDGRYLLASATTRTPQGSMLGFRVWDTDDWSMTIEVPGERGTQLGEMATGETDDSSFVAAYGREGTLELGDLVDNRVLWNVPLIPSTFAPSDSTILGTELDRVEIAPNGQFLITYESPRAHDPIGHVSGGIVVREARDGSVNAVYDVYGVTGLSISPDSETFVYSTGAGQVHTALVRVPRN
jgi:hypothetical protein